MPWKAFLEKGEELTKKEFRLYDVEIIKRGNIKRYVGAWKSGSGSNIITKGLLWKDFLKKGKDLTSQGLRLTDFEMFMAPKPQGPGTNPTSDPDPLALEFPTVPNYVQLLNGTLGNDKYRIVVDFTNQIDNKPKITIPNQFLKKLPSYEGEVIFPNNFCGMRIYKASRFVWYGANGNVLKKHPYNYIPEASSIEQHMQENNTSYSGYIDFTGPVGKCDNSNKNWMFPSPLTQTETVMSEPLKLVIELNPDSEVEFLNFNIVPGKHLDAKKMFKEVDFNKLIKFYRDTFEEDLKPWVDAFCEAYPQECPLQQNGG